MSANPDGVRPDSRESVVRSSTGQIAGKAGHSLPPLELDPTAVVATQLAADLKREGDRESTFQFNLNRYWLPVARRIVALGWRPPAQVITDPAELDALPEQAVIVITGSAFEKFGGWWHCAGEIVEMHSEQLLDVYEGAAATVVYLPTENGSGA